jgi:tetratricopeptide (TPR) repeat protein
MTQHRDADDYAMLVQELVNSGRWDLVERLCQEWRVDDPENPDAVRWLGWAALRQGQTEEARYLAEQLRGWQPDEHSTFALWAEIHYKDHDWAQALAAIRAAICRCPVEAYYYKTLGCILLRLRDPAAARSAIHEGLRLDPENVHLRALLRMAEHVPASGPRAVAQEIEAQRSLLASDPHNFAVLLRLGDLHFWGLDAPAAALPFYEQALAVNPAHQELQNRYWQARWAAEPPVEDCCLSTPTDPSALNSVLTTASGEAPAGAASAWQFVYVP